MMSLGMNWKLASEQSASMFLDHEECWCIVRLLVGHLGNGGFWYRRLGISHWRRWLDPCFVA
jgi:hypothetical protein